MDPIQSPEPLESSSIGTPTNIEGRLKSMHAHLQTEAVIFERLVYKNKNQHRRCLYFQALLKVRRDLKLLMSARLADSLNVMFPIVYSKQPAKSAFVVKRQKKDCNKNFGVKHNYQQRLLGVARILSQMTEPILFAATQISFLLAKSFFSSFSLIILALLARLRVLVQQMLLDVIFVYNTVSSLSIKKHSVKLMKGGIEAYREYQPCSEEAITLECVWEKDKFVLIERKSDSDLQNKSKDEPPLPSEMPVKYETIQLFSEDLFTETEQNLEEISPVEMQPTRTPSEDQVIMGSAMISCQKLSAEEHISETKQIESDNLISISECFETDDTEGTEPSKKKIKLDDIYQK